MVTLTLLLCLVTVAVSQEPGEEPGFEEEGSGGMLGSGEITTIATTKVTTKATTKVTTKATTKASATTKATTTTGTKVVFPKLTSPMSGYKYTTVFGIPVFAHNSISDTKFQHVASVLAEWVDNNEDGCVDTPIVQQYMVTLNDGYKAAVALHKDGADSSIAKFLASKFIVS